MLRADFRASRVARLAAARLDIPHVNASAARALQVTQKEISLRVDLVQLRKARSHWYIRKGGGVLNRKNH
jgi:hypothetical protein